MATLNFHVRHEVTPDRVWDVLTAIGNGTEIEHVIQFDRQLSRLRQLGLLTPKGEAKLTENGYELLRIGSRRLEVVWDLLHFLHFVRWKPSNPTEDTMFFTYVEYCNLLYSKREVDLAAQREILAAEMTSHITSSPYFADELSKLAKGAVSLSVNSLSGVEHWLEKLTPEAIVNKKFALRHYCSPELLLMALGYVTVTTDSQLEIEQPLSEDRRDMLCSICLIDESALDQMLDWLFPEYPDWVQPGTRTGTYGRFVRVMQLPSLKDLLR
jgi:hypothetical protein